MHIVLCVSTSPIGPTYLVYQTQLTILLMMHLCSCVARNCMQVLRITKVMKLLFLASRLKNLGTGLFQNSS